MPSKRSEDEPDPLGPARPMLIAALELGSCAAAAGDQAGAYSLFACAAKLARKVRGLGEVADFRLERALDEAEAEDDPKLQAGVMHSGLRSLVDDDSAEVEIPSDSLAAAQRFIGMAISIGAPAYNTGDRQGCFDVYSCTARMILASVPDLKAEPNAKLREALEECEELDDADRQAWTMRHAFDAVGEMGGGEGGVTLRNVRVLLANAISIGAPAFNLGDHRGCFEVYSCVGRLLVNSTAVPDMVKQFLRDALSRASVVPGVSRQAWIMREVFDAILGSASPPPSAASEPDEA